MPNVIFNNNSSFKSALRTPAHKATQNLMPVKSEEKSEKAQNNGGLVGGLGYFFEKIGVGLMQSVEGIWDYTAGGIADLLGADQWAEEQFANDWFGDWYSHPDKWFNPSDGWKFAGDVAAGIGTSLPALGTVGASVLSGGTLSPLAAGIISGGVAGLGAAGGATKEAYLETGKLDGAAYAYGALSGATEAGLEIATGLAGKGTGRIIKNLANKSAKEISEAAVKKTGKALLKQLGEDFVSEAFEEGFSEFITPYYKRMTYDPNAQNASLEEIGYAALVGGFSGMLMSGTSTAASATYDGIKGGSLVNKNRTESIVKVAESIAETERKTPSGDEVRENLVKVLDEFKESVGEDLAVSSFNQKKQLARLNRAIVAATYTPFIYHSAAKIVNDVDSVVERINSYGYKDKNGTPIVYTKEQLTAGIDFNNRKSIAKALKTNDSLRMLAISDAVGNLMLDTDKFVTTTLEGKNVATTDDLNQFAERAKPENFEALSKALNITPDEWRIMTPELFSAKFDSFYKTNNGTEYMRKGKLINDIRAIPESAAKTKTPSAVRTVKDGITRYKTDTLDFAIVKDGTRVSFYDYSSNDLTRDFTVGEVQKLLNAINDNAFDQNYTRARKAIEINENNTPFVVVEQDILNGVPESDWIKTVKSNLTSKFPNGVLLGKNTVAIDRQSRKEMTFSKYMQWLKKNNPQAFSDKLRATNNADEILNATQDWISEGLNHPRQDSITDFSRGSVLLRIGNNDYTAAVVVGTMKNGKMILYDIIDLVPTRIIKKEIGEAIPENSSRRAERKTTPISNNIIPGSSQKINTSSKKSTETQEKSAKTDQKTPKKGKKVEISISDELKAAGEFAEINVPEYKELSVPNKRAVRKTIMQAKAQGISDADITTFARFSAKSGINLSFDKSKLITGTDENGDVKYSDGMYDGNNTIYVNKDSSRKYSSLLFHELTHFLFNVSPDKLTSTLLRQAVENLPKERRNVIVEAYTAFYGKGVETSKLIDIINDEWFAHYTEDVLTDIDVLSFLDSKKPTLKETIVRFFSKSANAYKGEDRLSSAARKYAAKYRKLLNKVAELNQQNISSATDTRSLTSINQENMHVTGDNNEGSSDVTNTDVDTDIRFALISRTEDGRGIYRTNYPENTPKDVKQKDIVDLVQNVWSKKPIKLNIIVDSKEVPIEARFNPELAERSDLSKIAFGNRKGTASEKRITMNLSSDLYQIAEESHHVGSKTESGKDNAAHAGVTTWHYFLTDLVYVEADGTEIECYMNIDVKQNDSGHWFYSFAIEKGSRPADVLSVVTDKSATTSTISITENAEKINPYNEKTSKFPEEVVSVLSNRQAEALSGRGVEGDVLLDAADLARDILAVDGKITDDAKAVLYHGTTRENAKKINDTGKMYGKEDALFFSTKEDGLVLDYGEAVIEAQIPLEKLELNDIFGSEVHLTMKVKPNTLTNIRFALPETADAELSEAGIGEGKKRKIIADYTRSIVYSRKAFVDTLKAIPGGLDLKSATFNKYVDTVWENANTLTSHKEKLDFAHDIAVQIVDSIILEGMTENPDAVEARELLAYLRSGISRLMFSKTDVSEIRYHADKSGARRILARWGYKKCGAAQYQPYFMEQFVNDIASELPGMSDLKEMSPAEAFLEINDRYEKAVESAGEKLAQKYIETTDSERLFMITGIENSLMQAFRVKAEKSKFYKHLEQNISRYKEEAEHWKTKYDNDKGRNRVLGWLINEAQKMKDKKLGTFSGATQWKTNEFKNTIAKLSRIEFRKNFNETGTRNILKELSDWYVKDNPMLSESDYDDGISEMLKHLSKEPEDGPKAFTVLDLKILHKVMCYFNHFVENYNKVWRNGKWVEALPEAKRYVELLHEIKKEPPGFIRRQINKYFETFSDPESVVKAMDNYKSGFFSEIFYELREAAKNADVEEMNVKREYDTFLSDNKNYLSRAIGEEIEYRGVKIPKIKLIGLYLTLGREHSHAGFLYNGFTFTDKNGNRVNADGPITADTKTDSELLAYAKIERTKIWELMSETDRQYASILEYVFNSQCKQLKIERDMQRFGYSNATNEYYYPIKRADTAKNVDSTDIAEDIDHVTNSSFNKNTVTGSAGRLYIESADLVFNRHVKAVCMYAYLTPAIEAYNKLYNMDISGNRNKPISVATESVNVWKNGNTYFKNLISDIQGLPRNTDEPHALRSLRGGYAKFQLGANPKVWVTQFSSLFAASSMLDFDSIIKGFGVKTSTIDLYCPLAELRRRDNSAARAQGVLDKVDKIGNALMKPIGWVDSFVINKLYGACQVQIEKNGVAKVGTTENRRAAGELLTNVILSTQQNSMATERSGAMRTGNEIVRTLTMFSADSMKVIGRVFDSIGQINAYKTELRKEKEKGRIANQSPTGLSQVTKTGVIKNDSSTNSISKNQQKNNTFSENGFENADERIEKTDYDTEITMLEAKIKDAKLQVRKSVGALLLSAIYMAGVAELFRHILAKEDDDEPWYKTFLIDAFGNLFGGLPIIRDISGRILEGYGFDNYAYSAVNDLLDTSIYTFDAIGKMVTGEAKGTELARSVKKLINAAGQIVGIPTRNIYNYLYGLTKRFSPTTAYKIDNIFYDKNYRTDLYKALEKGDADMASMLMSILYRENVSEDLSDELRAELYELTAAGYKVLPRSVADTITYNGEDLELDEYEMEAVRSKYAEHIKSVEALVSLDQYRCLSDEDQASAIRYIYDLYYDSAIESTLGIQKGNSVLISKVIPAQQVALLSVATKRIESDKDSAGKTIAGTKRKKVISAILRLDISTEEKLFLIAAKGYSIKDGDIPGMTAEKAKKKLLSYILKLKLPKKEREALATLCGFEVKNGKVAL